MCFTGIICYLILFYSFLMRMDALSACMFMYHVYAQGGQRRACLNVLKLELHTVASYHVSAANRTRALLERGQSS